MTSNIAEMGGHIFCSVHRDAIMYQSAVLHRDVPKMVGLLAETVLHPRLTLSEISSVQDAIAFELEDLKAHPEHTTSEILHGIAYGDRGLGQSLICVNPKEISQDSLLQFRNNRFQGRDIVLAGIGVPHESLLDLAQEHFGEVPSMSGNSPLPISKIIRWGLTIFSFC
jgi:processing peptidase subunit alpha